MSTQPFFTICLPAYKRPQELCRAVESCLAQTDHDFEMVIGDDTLDDSVGQVISQQFFKETRIRYIQNRPPLRQALNVSNLFQEAKGQWIVLLHDDDYLEPAALSRYRQEIGKYPQADLIFGKQHLETAVGGRNLPQSEAFNEGYGRVPGRQGLITNPKEAVLRSQIPSNGFCVRAGMAKTSGYPGLPESGDACDWAFSVRLAMGNASFVYADAYVSTYSVANDSIGRNNPKNNAMLQSVKIAERYYSDQKGSPAYSAFFINHFGGAISQALFHGEKNYAWHLVQLAWADKRVPRGIVFKQLVKFMLPRKILFRK